VDTQENLLGMEKTQVDGRGGSTPGGVSLRGMFRRPVPRSLEDSDSIGDSIVAVRHHVMSCAGIFDARLPRHTQAEATSASPAIRGDRENAQENLLGMEKSGSMGAAALRSLESR